MPLQAFPGKSMETNEFWVVIIKINLRVWLVRGTVLALTKSLQTVEAAERVTAYCDGLQREMEVAGRVPPKEE